MARKLLKRLLPAHSVFRDHAHLRWLGTLLHDPDLWHLNRRSASGGAALGLFLAWVPLPFQMLLAAGAAMALRVNLPIAVVSVWITNPLTIAPMFYFAYKLGAWVLGHPAKVMEFHLTWEWFAAELNHIWAPTLVGSLILGTLSSLLALVLVRSLWRLHVVRSWQDRKRRRLFPGTPAIPPKRPA